MSGIRFAAIALLACGSVGCGQASPAASASAPAANDIAVRKASETGSTECDDYVRLVSHCIDTKMAESDRNDARRDLAIFRKAMANLSPTMQSAQAASCTDMIWRKIQFDSDGCYTEEAAGRGIVTPCTLLSHAELEAIVGAHLEQGVHDSTTCTYPFAGVVHIPLKITVHWKDGRDDMDAARGGEKLLAGKVGKNPVFDGLLSGETVPGLGDDASRHDGRWVAAAHHAAERRGRRSRRRDARSGDRHRPEGASEGHARTEPRARGIEPVTTFNSRRRRE